METAENRVTKEFLEDKLKACIESFSITSGSNAGDNFMSVIYAIEVNLKNGKTEFLVMKAYPTHPSRQDFLNTANLFSKEVEVYSQWIPELKKLDNNLKFAFAPFLAGNAVDYKSPSIDKKAPFVFLDNYLLMTDIRKTFGFKMADRRKGLNFQHTKLVLIELAKIHAGSWVYKKRHGLKSLIEKFPFLRDDTFTTEEVMESFKPMIKQMTEKALGHVKDELGEDSPAYLGISKLSGSDDENMDKLQSFLSLEGIDEAKVENWLRVKPECDPDYNMEPWMVGCHGDSWVNNMLFRYKDLADQTTPEEVNLIDLQLAREACPTTDITYFLVASTPFQLRRKHEAEFLEIYYNQFMKVCDEFAVKPMPGFSLAALRRRYRRAKIYGFFMGIPLLQIVLQDPTEAVDLDSLNKDSDMGEMFGSVTLNVKKHELLQEQISGLAQELYDDGVV